ncbi:2-hydroxy-3-oxopropionate reductase, putative [Trypanosoma brucei gambiense DAL972]|uniref:2-hydroxy-3-oxopropionate reductase, putative n=2 Tax=Trypanosoma brucei TaxID=5691 RepID=C9ZQG6_TRYB9|nr:2-hydroxy-3-oxopropionate reductase, putative [Trypanosoma brucei gambiense DAL972]RHW72180.1 2-hydroxy-3-oxopropionate reductase [Trypanosoma brucei equiperdum]CBH11646.1 2-hydroxy-3-oxopropionate reductase, putative [Trypanosoma brucei gambiense DAL972]|eukprot:XP_011773931.1 2-hydroxy-3-oxopropionate reductase, putative [Trypanosoma brucei gambiense DAL972]
MSLRVGYIGLGLMGKPMAANILKAGFPLVVFNRTRSKAAELVASGAKEAASPAELAAAVDVVFTNLSDSSDVYEVVFGKNGVYSGVRPGTIFVDNSTIKPSTAREIAERLWKEKQVPCLDAPVSGGDIGARNGTLTIMVGGDPEVLEKVRPVLQAMGKTITHIGVSGAGQVCKAANQIMIAAQMVAMGEMLVFAEKCGVDGQKVIDAVRGGSAQCWALDVKPQRLFVGNREPGFKAALQTKDLNIVMDSAREFGVPMPSTAVNTQLYQSMLQHGEGDLDNSAIIGVLERMANCKIKETKP